MECAGVGVVRHGSYHVQVAGGGTQQVAAQVAEGHQGVTEETESLPHQVEDALVLLPLLQRTDRWRRDRWRRDREGRQGGETGRADLRKGRETAETGRDGGRQGSKTGKRQGGEEVRRGRRGSETGEDGE